MPLITISAGAVAIPAGSYKATLVGIAPKHLTTAFTAEDGDDFLEWTWLVEAPDKDIEITSLTSLATGPKSTMFTYLLALVGPEKAKVGAGFEESDLVGKKVMVATTLTPDGFAKISGVMAAPVERLRRETPVAAPVAAAAPVAQADEDDLPF